MSYLGNLVWDWFFNWDRCDYFDIFFKMYTLVLLIINFIVSLICLYFFIKSSNIYLRRYTIFSIIWLGGVYFRERFEDVARFFFLYTRRGILMDITRLDEDWIQYECDSEFPEWFYPNLLLDWDWFFFTFFLSITDWILNIWEYIFIYWEDNFIIDWD